MSSSRSALQGGVLHDVDVGNQPDPGIKPAQLKPSTVMISSAIPEIEAKRLSHTKVDATTPSLPSSNIIPSITETRLDQTAPTALSSEAPKATESARVNPQILSGAQASTVKSSLSQAAVAYNDAVRKLFLTKDSMTADRPLHEYLVSTQPLQKSLLAPGDILWLNPIPFGLDKTLLGSLSSADPSEISKISNHPCIVLDVLPENVDRVKFYLGRTFGGKNPRNLRKIKARDQAYIWTIDHPKGHEAKVSVLLKHQNPRVSMPKPSYVDTRIFHVFEVSTIVLTKVTRDLPLKHYSLDHTSTQALQAVVRRSERHIEEGEWRIRQQERQVVERALEMETQHRLYIEDTKKHHPISLLCEDWCKANSREVGKTEYKDCGNCMQHLNVERFRGLECHNRACPCPKSSRC